MTLVIRKKDDNSALGRFLTALRCQLTLWKDQLCQNYTQFILYYVGLQIPLQVPLLDLSFVAMSSNRGDSSRDESFFSSKDDTEEEALSPGNRPRIVEDSFDSVLRQNSSRQNDITNNMLEMARTLKARTQEANNLIKRDIKKLEEAKHSVEGNMTALSATSSKLASVSKSGMNWCLIILLIVVLVIFINMVLLMKIAKKN